MTLLLTRSKEDAAPTLEALESAGHSVAHEPLLTIVSGPDAGAEPDIVLDGVQALLATSANSVRAIRRWDRAKALPLLAVGPRTAQTARDLGFARVDEAGGDVEKLAELAAEKLDAGLGPVLHVAGKVRAGDLKGLLEAQNFTVKRVVLYEAEAAKRFSDEARIALEAGHITGVLFYSPRTAEIFLELVRAAGLDAVLAGLTAYCLSANIADRLQGSNWKAIEIADRPDDAAMLALLPEPAPDLPRLTASATPEVEPADDPKAKTPKAKKPGILGWRVAGVLALVLGGLVVGLFGVASLPQSVQGWFGISGGESQSVDLSGIEERLAALEAREDSLPVVTHGEPGPDHSDAIAALADRIDTLEARPVVDADGSVDLSEIENQITSLKLRIAYLAEQMGKAGDGGTAAAEPAAPQADPQIDPQELADLRAELDALAGQVARNRTLAETVEKKVGRAAQSGLAFATLERAAQSGVPFARELELITEAPPAASGALSVLGRHAVDGVKTKPQLIAAFDPLARDILDAAKTKSDESWLDRLWRNVQGVVTIRPVGEAAGDDAGAIVARTEARLKQGALAEALVEMGKLKGLAATVAEDWVQAARARVETDRALDELSAMMIAAGGAS